MSIDEHELNVVLVYMLCLTIDICNFIHFRC